MQMFYALYLGKKPIRHLIIRVCIDVIFWTEADKYLLGMQNTKFSKFTKLSSNKKYIRVQMHVIYDIMFLVIRCSYYDNFNQQFMRYVRVLRLEARGAVAPDRPAVAVAEDPWADGLSGDRPTHAAYTFQLGSSLIDSFTFSPIT